MVNKSELMNSIPISQFKAHAISALKRVRDTGESLRVTIRGKAVAEIFPPVEARQECVNFGSCAELTLRCPSDADLVGNDFSSEWEMNR